MMLLTTRRQFFGTMGHALGCAALGVNANEVLAFSTPRDSERLRFGALDPLVDRLQESTPDDVLPLLVSKLRTGLALSEGTESGQNPPDRLPSGLPHFRKASSAISRIRLAGVQRVSAKKLWAPTRAVCVCASPAIGRNLS